MRAFTHLCEKINISLMKDTLTIYPKNKSPFSMEMSLRVINAEAALKQSFDFKCFVLNFYQDHSNYHWDSFDRKNDHLHIQYSIVIDEFLFEECMTVLLDEALISPEEKGQLMATFHKANTLEDIPLILYSSEEQNLKNELVQLRLKANYLRKNAYFSDQIAQQTRELYEKLTLGFDSYCSNRTIVSLVRFKINSRELIATASKRLAPYDELKQWMSSLLPMLGVVGETYLPTRVLSSVIGGRFSFFNTGVESNLSRLTESLNEINSP